MRSSEGRARGQHQVVPAGHPALLGSLEAWLCQTAGTRAPRVGGPGSAPGGAGIWNFPGVHWEARGPPSVAPPPTAPSLASWLLFSNAF